MGGQGLCRAPLSFPGLVFGGASRKFPLAANPVRSALFGLSGIKIQWDFRAFRFASRAAEVCYAVFRINMAKKSKEHWGNLISSLEENAETPAEETDVKPAKGRAKAPAARKRASKKEKAAPPLEKTLLDSFDSTDAQLDLTVGAEEPSEKKTRRSRKTEKGLVEKAVAAEEKKDREIKRAKREKLAEAIVEKAKEPFREIASQIEERIAELSKEETGEPEEKPAKKRTELQRKTVFAGMCSGQMRPNVIFLFKYHGICLVLLEVIQRHSL